MDDTRVYITAQTLGYIEIIQSSCEFPWELFVGGEINCGFYIKSERIGRIEEGGVNMNKVRIWLDENLTDTCYLTYNDWAKSKIGFQKPETAIKFQLKFGDYLDPLSDV